jgi:Class II Aldolase and Adducin N-terminal domain
MASDEITRDAHSRLDVSTTLVEDLVVANRVLASHGVLDAFGHVSARSDHHADRYVLAHFLAPEMVDEDDLIEYDLNSNPIAPAPPKQYLERYIHGEIYRARPDVMAVVVRWARRGEELPREPGVSGERRERKRGGRAPRSFCPTA